MDTNNTLAVNDRVSITIDGKVIEGTVLSVRLNSGIVRVSAKDLGKTYTLNISEVTKLRRGFKQYNIIWKPGEKGQQNVNFRFTVTTDKGEKVEFHGWWRKSEVRSIHGSGAADCYCIDIYCKWNGKQYALKTIPYFTEDPRSDLPSLSADITAAANEFIWGKLNGNASVLAHISQMAAEPLVKITSMRTLDALIHKLTEHRAASIAAGGPRHCDIRSDEEGGPRVVFAIDLTMQHVALEGRVPSLIEGAIYDTASKGKKGGEKLEVKMDAGNLSALVAQLKSAKDRGDQVTARKIRATLRKLGHRGGARSADKQLGGGK